MRSEITGIVLATIMLASIFLAMAPVGSPETSFNVYLSTNSVNPRDEFFIYGTAPGVEGVNILIVSPSGPYGSRINDQGRIYITGLH